ncbi:2OG-FeII-Oxy-2 domain-containing protein [Mycena venus]|uniref:2OG-FeII-Oxy-2 domain-containing protein n=1 Tax=Mycena venus TaxID=2733690 RepID=A0A8H7CZ95_9AGAR|nr:2OG-FeII-Oxy-2 domain-containing protein [Mycena venus]
MLERKSLALIDLVLEEWRKLAFKLDNCHNLRGQKSCGNLVYVDALGQSIVVEGAGVQEFYEHTVVSCNFRIAATVWWIEPNYATAPNRTEDSSLQK